MSLHIFIHDSARRPVRRQALRSSSDRQRYSRDAYAPKPPAATYFTPKMQREFGYSTTWQDKAQALWEELYGPHAAHPRDPALQKQGEEANRKGFAEKQANYKAAMAKYEAGKKELTKKDDKILAQIKELKSNIKKWREEVRKIDRPTDDRSMALNKQIVEADYKIRDLEHQHELIKAGLA